MLAAFVFLVMAGPLGAPQPEIGRTDFNSGTVKIIPDPAFGKSTEWDVLFKPTSDKWTAFLPDGSFFRTASAEGQVHKFDSEGKLLKSFGRQGQGPGDLQAPGALDVLDGKILVVNDAGNQRLSLFDLDGNFLKIVKPVDGAGIPLSVLSLTALDEGRVVDVAYETRSAPPNVLAARYRVLIKDLADGQDKELAVFDWERPLSKFRLRVMEWEPAVFLAKAGPGKVLVACSGTPEIAFFSYSGEKLSSFSLDIERTKITWKHLEFAVRADENPKNIEFLAKNKSDIELPEFLPCYSRLALDAQGRVLVYDYNAARFSREASFKAFSLEGRPLASVKIDPAGHKPVMPVHFWKEFAYAYLTKAGDDDSFIFARFRLVSD